MDFSSHAPGFGDSGVAFYAVAVQPMRGDVMARVLFQCPNCGLGDGELGHLMDEDDVDCIVCLEELGRQIRVECWGEGRGPMPASGLVWLLPEA
jgi:hypothetical protein